MYAEEHRKEADTILENFAKAQNSMGINVSENPDFIEVPDKLARDRSLGKGKAYAQEINRALNPKTRIVLVLIRFPDQYKIIKSLLD